MKRRILPAVLVAGYFVNPTVAAAQVDLDVRVIPRAGILTPADWFYEEFAHLGVDPLEWTEAAVLRSALVGLTAELELVDLGIWVRGEVLRTLGGETSVVNAYLIEASTAGPPQVVRTAYWVPTSLTIGTLDVGLPTALRLPWSVQPYITAGIGGKRYAFDLGVLENADDDLIPPEDGVTFVTNVGGGLTAPLTGRLGIDLLARDAMSHYWGKLQHDVMVLIGVSWQAL
jgi:hypothetical protein